MKATEFMIGNWVYYPLLDKNVKVHSVGNDGHFGYEYNEEVYFDYISRIKPIPLTAEILEKNFPKSCDKDYWVDGDFPIIGYSIPCITDGHRPYVEVSIYDPARVMEFEMYFHYVHELQHALRLCGFDKEIEL